MLSDSIAFGLLAGLLFGGLDLGIAIVSRKASNLQMILGSNLAAVVAATGYLTVSTSLAELELVDWLSIAGVSVGMVVSHVLYYAAMRAGPVAIVSPISAAHSAIPIVLAVIFLGERMNIGQSVGATAAVCGIVLAALDLRALKSGTSLVGKGTLLALAAMLTFGLVLYFLALLSRDLGWFIPAYVLRMMSVALVAPVSVARREPPWRGITSWVVAGIVLLGLFDIGGAFAFARGAEIGQISIVAAASSGYPLVAIGGGILLFRERLALSQIAGIVSILAGLVLLGLVS